MKKILAVLLTIALIVPCFASLTYASSSEALVRSLHFTVDTSNIDVGTSPDDLDYNYVKVVCTEVTDSGNEWNYSTHSGTVKDTASTYPNLTVRISDLQCTNDTSKFKIGDTVKFKFWVEISGYKTLSTGGSEAYYFSSSSNMGVAADSSSTGPKVKSVSKSRSGTQEMKVTVTCNPLKGTYTAPDNLQWLSGSLGKATWEAPEDENMTGYYDIKLCRNGSSVYSQSKYFGTSFDFYPWMTKEGEYTFKVRSVTASDTSTTYGKASDWNESDGQEVAKDKVSDGSGQSSSGSSGSSSNVGWKQNGNDWYYYYPDGTMKKNGWEKISNKWYLFGSDGKMLKGWQTYQNNTYYLDSTNGDMKTGWINTSDGQWYYLTALGTGGTEGAMYKNSFLDYKNYRYYLCSTGAMATGWTKIGQDTYYFRPNESDGCPKGSMVTNQRVDSFWLGADGKWVQGQ